MIIPQGQVAQLFRVVIPATREGSGEEEIVRICVLASSSSGNCTFIGTGRTRLLIDAGLSRKATFGRLAELGEAPEKLDAILVTHEHADHVSGLALIARKLDIPIFLTALTAPTIPWIDHRPKLEEFQAGTSFTIGDIEVQSFTVPHDAADPVGYSFRAEGLKIGLVTDLGYIPESVKFHVREADLLVLESNHDVEMLKVGPYPWSVKQRVMSRQGHLSNDVVSDFILGDLTSATQTLVLGHLSEQNNHPEIVRLVAQQALDRRGLTSRLVVAEPRKRGEMFQF